MVLNSIPEFALDSLSLEVLCGDQVVPSVLSIEPLLVSDPNPVAYHHFVVVDPHYVEKILVFGISLHTMCIVHLDINFTH